MTHFFEPSFALGFFNAWLLCVPLVLQGIITALVRKDIAKRMSDITGYHTRERVVTVLASLLPYPLVALTVWTPFGDSAALLASGLVLWAGGMAGMLATILVFARTPATEPLAKGLYRVSRNPFYVSAALVFLGICLATANLVLVGLYFLLLVLQHFMILAEERVCRQKYGAPFEAYMKRVPRYFLRL